MERTGRLKSWFGRYDKDLETALNSGEFGTKIDSLQAYKSSDIFYTGNEKFYSGGEISFAPIMIDNGYSKNKEEHIIKSFASALGSMVSSAKYEKPAVSGDNATYTLTGLDCAWAAIPCSGSENGEVKITINRKSGEVGAKYIIKTEKKIINGKEVDIPQHKDMVRGYLNKIYYGTFKAGNLTFKYRLDAEAAKKSETKDASKPDTSKQDAKEKQPDKKEKLETKPAEPNKNKSTLEDALKMIPEENDRNEFKKDYGNMVKVTSDPKGFEDELKNKSDAEKEELKKYYALANSIVNDPVGYVKGVEAMRATASASQEAAAGENGSGIILPKNLESELRAQTQQENEICGRAFASRQGDNLIIENCFVTGEGSPGTVTDSENALDEIAKYQNQHPDQIMINFHTHSEGTRKRYNKKYMYDFSEQDEGNIKANPNDIAMLITPEVIKARKGNSEVNVAVA